LESLVTQAVLGQWIALAKEWQPLLAGVLAVIASIIFAVAIIKAAQIHVSGSKHRDRTVAQDLRYSPAARQIDTTAYDDVIGNLEKLRSLLRSALSSLSSVNPDNEAARALCARIASSEWQYFSIPADTDKRLQETYGALLNQFELLRKVLREQWSNTEASSILIQLNASARTLIDALSQKRGSGPELHYPLKQK
jgi:hypothetical protein